MILKYLVNLMAVVVSISLLCMPLAFVQRAQVLGGKVQQETWKSEFTIARGPTQTLIISPAIKAQLGKLISFVGSGAVRVTSAKVMVTPKEVSWTENRAQFTSAGAALAAELTWETSAEAADGAYGEICIVIPHTDVTFRSGGYQKYADGRCVVRQVRTHRGALSLWIAKFVQALGAGVPLGILVQSIWWGVVLTREKKARLAALPQQAPGALPHVFYSSPIAEWAIWTLMLGIFGFVASLIAFFVVCDGFMSTGMYGFILGAVGVGAVVATISAVIARSRVLTIQLDADSFSYTRGRGPADWITTRWSAPVGAAVKSQTYRGNRTEWVELTLPDDSRLKIGASMIDYPGLRDMILSLCLR